MSLALYLANAFIYTLQSETLAAFTIHSQKAFATFGIHSQQSLIISQTGPAGFNERCMMSGVWNVVAPWRWAMYIVVRCKSSECPCG